MITEFEALKIWLMSSEFKEETDGVGPSAKNNYSNDYRV